MAFKYHKIHFIVHKTNTTLCGQHLVNVKYTNKIENVNCQRCFACMERKLHGRRRR